MKMTRYTLNFRRGLAVVGLLVSLPQSSMAAGIEYGDIVESDYYQMDARTQAKDAKNLEAKEQLAQSSAKILAAIAQIDEQIDLIDRDLAKYTDDKARATLLAERKKLFRKRREYKDLAAAYNQKQMRMTSDLAYGSRGETSDEFTLQGTPGGNGVDTPLWKKATPGDKGKPFIKVEKEKNLKELAQVLSRKIYGEVNQDIYIEILQQNHNNAIDPNNLMAGDIVFLPVKIAMLTMMGLQQKSLLDSTMLVIAEVKDPELKRNLVRYAAYADESPASRKAFLEVLVALKVSGESSEEFKRALTNFHRASESSDLDSTTQMIVSAGDGERLQFTGAFRDKVVAVSNASVQLDMLPADTAAKVKKAAEEYRKLKVLVKDYGNSHSRTKEQLRIFQAAVNDAYDAVQAFKNSGGSMIADDRYTVRDDTSGDLSSANASASLQREIREINRGLLAIASHTVSVIKDGWTKEGSWWQNLTGEQKKEASRKLLEKTDLSSENSQASQLMNRLKMVYAQADRYRVDLYREANFGLLRKRMISLVGLSMVVQQIQPAYLSRDDNKFRDLTPTTAIQQLGIDVDKRDYDFYDRGSGAKGQFEKLNSNAGARITDSVGLRDQWKDLLTKFASLRADFKEQDRFKDTTIQANKFWKEQSDKLERHWSRTIGYSIAGAGVGGLTLLAAANFWNPVGWVVGGVLVGGTAVGLVVGNNADQAKQVEMIKQYGDLKIISEMAVLSTKEDSVKMVETMLYFDEIVKGY